MKLTQITGNEIELNINSEQARKHFDTFENYAAFILDEWKTQPFKDFITKEHKVILDIGANVGLFALHVLPYAEKIICVEPTPAHMEIQKELINDSKIQHEQSALNYYTGKAKFHHEPVNTTMNTLRDDGFEVDCITLNDLCTKYNLEHVDLCKIDIEGSEFKALTVQTVSAVFNLIDNFLIELHPRTRQSQDHFKSIFEQSGYKVDYYDFNGSIFCYK
jgi:FkbM family methyltransferase